MGTDSTFVANAQAAETTLSMSKALGGPVGIDRDFVRSEERPPLASEIRSERLTYGFIDIGCLKA